MNTPIVSIIVPVYNTAKYIRETISSLQHQTFSNFEIILINDGSTDDSLAIIKELASADARLHVYDYPNGGVSIARNRGLKHVKGKYIYFLDSDDLLISDCLQLCVERAERDHLDLLLFDGESFTEDDPSLKDDSLRYDQTSYFDENEIYVGTDVLLEKYRTRSFNASPCLIFFKTTLVTDHSLSFIPHIIHEDEHYIPMLYLYAKRVGVIPALFYRRRFRPNSIMTNQFAWRNIIGYITVSDTLIAYKKAHRDRVTQQIIDTHLHIMLPAVVWRAHVLSFRERLRLLFICLHRYPNYIPITAYLKMFFKKTVNWLSNH